MSQKPTFTDALKFWIKLGFISFGGPAGQIAIMHDYLVDKKQWISNSRFMHALNYCMILPGPEAQQLATYMGWLLHGRWGGLAAGMLFVLPSMLILLTLSMVYVSFGNIPWIGAMFDGLKPAVIAIVMLALVKIATKSLQSLIHYMAALAAFVAIFFFNVPFPLIIIAALLLGTILKYAKPKWAGKGGQGAALATESETDYYINKHTVLSHTGFRPKRTLRQIATAAMLWLTGMALLYLLTNDWPFWKNLSIFFTKAAFVTFGGAYAVLPYVAQVSVEKFNWLTNLQMVDGLALGETTPGPLIMVLAFVGFMAGYNHYGHSLAMGALGLTATTFYTFLPCFLFIFAGAPLIERTQENRTIKQLLALVSAAVVGVILNLTVYLGKAVLFANQWSLAQTDYWALAWVVVSLVALHRFKVNMMAWIGVSAVWGVVMGSI